MKRCRTYVIVVLSCLAQFVLGQEYVIFNHAEMAGSLAKGFSVCMEESPSILGLNHSEMLVDLSLGRDYAFSDSPFSVSLELNVSIKSQNLQQHTEHLSLRIDQDTPLNFINQNLLPFFQPSDLPSGVQVEVSNYTLEVGSARMEEYLKDSLRLTVQYVKKYKQDVNLEAQHFREVTTLIQDKRITFNWEPFSIHYPVYEIQIMKLYNTKEEYAYLSGEGVPQGIRSQVDWKNALKLRLDSGETSLSFSLAEGSGYYIWRIRAIGNTYKNGAANPLNHGMWYPPNIPDFIDHQHSPLPEYLCYYDDPDENNNYIYSRTFTEGKNHISESISYANGLNRPQQSQKYLPSKDTKVIIQSIYDLESREAITTLPEPKTGGLAGYETDYVLDEQGTSYSVKNFDTEETRSNPDPLSDSSIIYYEENDTERIANAFHFPYRRTRYTNDGTHRISEENQPGVMFKAGSAHSTQFWYVSPSQDELAGIFGDEAPNAASVTKTIIKDPNGIYSVKYTTNDGKTIATCLLNTDLENPHMMKPDNDQGASSIIYHRLLNNYRNKDTLYTNSRITLLNKDTLSFKYSLPLTNIALPCGEGIVDCGYVLKVSIYDVQEGTYLDHFVEAIDPNDVSKIVTINGKEYYQTILREEYPLLPGSYIIEKKLFQGEREAMSFLFNPALSVEPYIEVINRELDKVTDEEAQLSFFSKMFQFRDDLGDAINGTISHDAFLENWSMDPATVVSPEHALLIRVNTTNGVYLINTMSDVSMYIDSVKYLDFQTPCCNVITIPLYFPSMFDCPENPTPGNPSFEAFMRKVIGGTEGQYNEQWARFMPGWNKGEFDQLIYNMLTYELPDPSKQQGMYHVYSCAKLWKLWSTVVNSYAVSTPPYPDGKLSSTIYNRENTARPTLDNNISFSGLKGWVMEWLVKRRLSRLIEEEEESSTQKPLRSANLAEVFLNMAGYHFEKVITSMAEAQQTPGYDPSRRFTIGAPDDIRESKEHPYIMDRLWAFRYFQYIGDSLGINRKPACEIMNCFTVVDYGDYCMEPPACTPYANWKEEDIMAFFNCLMSYVPQTTGLVTQDTIACKDPIYYTETMVDSIQDLCLSKCEEKRAYYRDMVTHMVKERCYVIDGCFQHSNYISSEMITEIVDAIVGECTAYCEMNAAFVCTKKYCQDINSFDAAKRYYRLFVNYEETCDRVRMQVSDWFIEFDIASQCAGEEGTMPSKIDVLIPLLTVETCSSAENPKDIKYTAPHLYNGTEQNGSITIQKNQ